jgi:hypothetical protein
MSKRLVYGVEIDTNDAQNTVRRIQEALRTMNQDTEVSQREINGLTQELKNLGDETTEVATETDKASRSVKTLQQEYKELVKTAAGLDQSSEEFRKVTQRAGELKNQIDDTNNSIRNLSGAPITNISNSFQALLSNVRELNMAGVSRSFNDLVTSLKIATRQILGMNTGLSGTNIALRAIGVSIAASGIGLFIASISVLVKNFDLLKSSGGAIGSLFNTLGGAFSLLTEKVLGLTDALGLTGNALEQYYKKQKEEEDKANGITVRTEQELAKDISELRRKLYNDNLDELGKAIDEERAKRQEEYTVFIFDLKKDIKNRLKTQQEGFELTQEFIAESERRLQKIRDDFAEERRKKEAELSKKIKEDRIKNLLESFDRERKILEDNLNVNVTNLDKRRFEQEKKLTNNLIKERERGWNHLTSIDSVLAKDINIKDRYYKNLFQLEYKYFDDLYNLKEKLIEQEKDFDDPIEKLEIAKRIAIVEEELITAKTEQVEKILTSSKLKVDQLINSLNKLSVADFARNLEEAPGQRVIEQFRLSEVEGVAKEYRERLIEVLSGGGKGLFAEAFETTAEVRSQIEGELVRVNDIIKSVRQESIVLAEKEIQMELKSTDIRKRLSDTELERFAADIDMSQKRITILQDYHLTETQMYKDALFEKMIAEKQYNEAVQQLDQETADKKKANLDKEKEERTQVLNQIVSSTANAMSRIIQFDTQMTNIKLQNSNLTFEEEEKLRKESFERQKSLALVNAVINAALGVTNALATSGPPWVGLAMAAIVAATSVAEIAVISASQYTGGTAPTGAGAGGVSAPSIPTAPTNAEPNINFIGAGAGGNQQTGQGTLTPETSFYGSVSVSEINDVQNLIEIFEGGSGLGGG